MAIKGDADKKKMVILVALVVVIGGVGAFQFISGSSGTPPTAKKEKKKDEAASGPIKRDIDQAKNVAAAGNVATANANSAMPNTAQVTDVSNQVAGSANLPESDPLRKLYAMSSLPTRDPFEDTTNPKLPDTVQQQQPPQQTTKPPRRNTTQGPVLPPFPIDGTGSLPGALGGAQVNIGNGQLPVADEFGYRVNGMIEGARPAVVFSDGQGNQKLVPVGGAIDGDSRVISASNGKVVVSHKGKKLTLTMGGQPNAN